MKYYDHFKTWLKATGQRNSYDTLIKKFIKFTEDNNIQYKDITFDDMNRFVNTLQDKKLTEGSINNYIKAVRSFYSFLIKSQVITEEVLERIKGVKLLKTVEKERTFFKIEEIDEIIEMASSFVTSISPIKLRAILYFMFYSGVRKQELVNLKRENIYLKEQYAVIKAPTKTKKERKVPFTKEVIKILEIYFTTEPETQNAFNISYSQLYNLFTRLKEFSPNNKPFTPHILRTSFFYFLAKSGFNLRQMQKLGGHLSIESTQRYYNPTEDEALDAYKEILQHKKPKRKKK